MMFISILLFFLPPPLYYFFFPFYRPITHTVHVYNSNTDGIFQENNTKKKERKKKNQITIIEAQTSRSKILQYIELSMEKYSPSVPRPFHQILETFQSNCTVIRRYSRKSIVHYQPRSP